METVNATFPSNVFPVDFKFRFKKDAVGNQRASVELKVPVLSLSGVKEVLELDVIPKNDSPEEKARVEFNKNQQDLIIEALQDVYRDVIGDWVGDKPENNADAFDPSKFTWAAIANMPKEDRRSSAIPKELWEDFAKDYAAVMKAVAKRTDDQIVAALTAFQKKFNPVKTNKPAIEFLRSQLSLYVEHTQNGENLFSVIELLVKKANDLLKDKSTENLVDNLGM